MSNFPPTRPSILERIRTAAPEEKGAAFDDLARGYWRPIHTYLRLKWSMDEHDAEDATQAFLQTAWEKSFFDSYDPAKARFRTFLRVCLDRFVMNRAAKDAAQRRGGGMTPVSMSHADSARMVDDDDLFRQEMVRDLFARALEIVRAECERTGRMTAFRVFELYDIDPADGVKYADLAQRFGVPTTQITNYLALARRLFREAVVAELRLLCGDGDEFRAEVQALLGIEVA